MTEENLKDLIKEGIINNLPEWKLNLYKGDWCFENTRRKVRINADKITPEGFQEIKRSVIWREIWQNRDQWTLEKFICPYEFNISRSSDNYLTEKEKEVGEYYCEQVWLKHNLERKYLLVFDRYLTKTRKRVEHKQIATEEELVKAQTYLRQEIKDLVGLGMLPMELTEFLEKIDASSNFKELNSFYQKAKKSWFYRDYSYKGRIDNIFNNRSSFLKRMGEKISEHSDNYHSSERPTKKQKIGKEIPQSFQHISCSCPLHSENILGEATPELVQTDLDKDDNLTKLELVNQIEKLKAEIQKLETEIAELKVKTHQTSDISQQQEIQQQIKKSEAKLQEFRVSLNEINNTPNTPNGFPTTSLLIVSIVILVAISSLFILIKRFKRNRLKK